MRAFTIWFTGLPCSGKTTLAVALQKRVGGQLLDGDVLRDSPISADADFSPEGRRKHLLRVAAIAKMLNDNEVTVLASFVSPSEVVRQEVAAIVGKERFQLVYVNTPAEECERRDTRGLWKKARTGEIKDFTGVSAPYEVPPDADLWTNTCRIPLQLYVTSMIVSFFSEEKAPPASLFIGRYQPLHAGHVELISVPLQEGAHVVVALRDTSLSEGNPYTIHERTEMFRKAFPDDFGERLVVIAVPDIADVCYGRKVGWGMRKICLSEELEQISATEIRKHTE